MLFSGVLPQQAFAVDYVWNGTASDVWGDSTRWSPNSGIPNSSADTATISGTTSGNVKIGGLYTINALTLSRATTIETTPTSFDPTRGLTLAIASGSPTITASGGDSFFYANLFGNQGFTKLGDKKFTFRFNALDQTYTGAINISAGVLGINQNGSLGNNDNDITIGNGARLLAEPGSNSGTITLPSTRTFTLAGVQSQIGAGNVNVTLVIEGNIGESAAGNGLVITDNGRVVLAGALSYTGETRLAGGTLELRGPALLPSTQNLRFNGGAAATFDLGGASQTVRTIVMEGSASPARTVTNGSLTINGDAIQQISGRNAQTFDFAGLNTFTFNRSTRAFNVQTINADAITTLMDVNLAKAGTSGGSNTITASAILVGGGDSTGNNGNTARLHLGTVNVFNTSTLQIGGFNAGGVVDFQSGLTSPSLKLRGADTTSAMTLLKVGETSSGTRRGEGNLNLTGGSIDAVVTDIQLGRHVANSNNADSSSITIPSGSLTAGTLTMAQKTGTGTPVLTSTFHQGGGAVRITTITMGADAAGGATPKLLPTYNLLGGTLFAAVVDAGSGAFASDSSRTLNLNGGTLRNYDANTNLAVDGVDSSAGGRLNVVVGASGATVHADPGRTVTFSALAPITGAGKLTKAGGGTLILNGTASPAGGIDVSGGTLSLNAGAAVSANVALLADTSATLANTSTIAGNVSVASGATLRDDGAITGNVTVASTGTLQGTGSITGTTAVNGNLNPGNSTGTLTFNGSLTLSPTSITNMELSSVATNYDVVDVNSGTLTYDGTLNVDFGNNTYANGTSFKLFDFAPGSFANDFDAVKLVGTSYGGLGSLIANAGLWKATFGGTLFTFDGGAGTLSLSAQAVPEPLTAAGVILLAGRVLGRRSRASL